MAGRTYGGKPLKSTEKKYTKPKKKIEKIKKKPTSKKINPAGKRKYGAKKMLSMARTGKLRASRRRR